MKMKEIKWSIENNLPSFQEILKFVNSFGELCKLYDLPNNGKQHKYFKEIISKNNFDISSWNWHSKLKKYEDIEKMCPICQNKFITQKGHPRETFTCSYSCSNTFFKRHTKESKQKISTFQRKIHPKIEIICIICGTKKIVKRKTQKCCSNKCGCLLRKSDPTYIKKLKDGVQRSIKEGRHRGWKSRKIISYPEKFFMDVLKNNNISYRHNLPCGKYFIDFGIENKNIALEIDGKQHKYPDRIIKDQEKDKFLIEEGWNVYRLDWNSINTNDGKKLMKEKIDKFIDFLNKR